MRLMIGYGNTLRSDDGLGPFLSELLGEGWHVITGHQLMPEYAEPISQAECVVFMDAAHGDTPGEVVVRPVLPEAANEALSHNVTPAALLASTQDLYRKAPCAILVTVTGADFRLGTHFSPTIAALIPHLIETIRTEIEVWQASKTPRTPVEARFQPFSKGSDN
jgi:hydrogenase maturation protease